MIQEISKRLLSQLESELETVGFRCTDPFEKWTASLKLVRDALKKLRVHFEEGNSVRDKLLEIHFFKCIKPAFYHWNIYCSELYEIETNLPKGDVAKQVAFLETELLFISRFFRQYAFLYQYYKLGADDLDGIYFVRGAQVREVLVPNLPDPDPGFSTGCDYLFAKFRAFEKLQDWLVELLLILKRNPGAPVKVGEDSRVLHWTGDTINLAEIGIGIHQTAQVNHGSASIADIFRLLEESFHVSLGIPSKRVSELRRRKRLDRAQYLVEMRESIDRKLDKENEFDGDKGNGRRIGG